MADREQSDNRRFWERQITGALKRLDGFHKSGDTVIDQYRIEKRTTVQQDKYNILFSNTETIKPSLYAQTPKVEVEKHNRDLGGTVGNFASLLLEQNITYQMKDQDFDDVIMSAVEDYLLPGIGTAWARYDPIFKDLKEPDGAPVMEPDGKTVSQELVYEYVSLDYVNWRDFLFSRGRTWVELWWVAKGVYFSKTEAEKRFGKAKARKFQWTGVDNEGGSKDDIEEKQIRLWEIWDKRHKKVIWYSPQFPDDVVEEKPDFLRLQGFFPCPRPMRAIKTNNKFEPRPFYAQYQAQADELNDITHKIRKLVDALRVIGIYDASVDTLKNLLTGTGNKMVPVEGWATVQDKGGLKGVVDFLPITEIANVLMQLYEARRQVKDEIYEITGWSDIIRGVSKASETLGAQKLKSDWAGSRLKLMQKEVQRFIRDLLRIVGEIISEHFAEETLALGSGVEFEGLDDKAKAEFAQMLSKCATKLKEDRSRCALINVETDSTLMPDEANDKKERMEFVGAVGAFLQQAVPAMKATPALGPLLGEVLMFAVRSFRGSRSIEGTFEQFKGQIAQQAAQPEADPNEAKNKAAEMTAMQKTEQTKMTLASEDTREQARVALETQQHNDEMTLKKLEEDNRHSEAMEKINVEKQKVLLARADLQLEQDKLALERQKVIDDNKHKDADRELEAEQIDIDRIAEQSEQSEAGDEAGSSENELDG